jgi:hypothetical protein
MISILVKVGWRSTKKAGLQLAPGPSLFTQLTGILDFLQSFFASVT